MSKNGYLAVIKVKKRYRKPGDPHPKKNVLVRNFSISCPFDKMGTDVNGYKVWENDIYISSEGPPHWNVGRICN